MRRFLAILLTTIVGAVGLGAPASAQEGASVSFPDVISLPDGFFPEGIAIGNGTTFFTGSLVDGAIYRGDFRSGEGDVLVPGQQGLLAVGMGTDRRGSRLFVAGGPTGTARVYNTDDGSLLADLRLGDGFVNDVIVTKQAAYFTNSFAAELYEVPLDPRGNVAGPVRTIPLSGDFQFSPGAFNANGIESVDRHTLIVVNSSVGALYTVDKQTGVAATIDTAGETVNGDGLVLVGRTLYAVVGGLNQITELRLSRDLGSALVTDTITDSAFDVPTTAARRGSHLYAVNAKFNTPVTPETPYEVVRVRR